MIAGRPVGSPETKWWVARLESIWWRPLHGFGSIWLFALWPLSWIYRALAAVDRTLGRWIASRERGLRKDRVPTIVVGNWVLGGAGKTPTTLSLLEHLKTAGWRPGVVSRGYGGQASGSVRVDPVRTTATEVGDEPLLIARRGQVPVVVGRNRRQARALLLAQEPQVNIVVADDGLQHHRLWRDLEIAVVDERGAGNGYCLPAGPLREPLPRRLGDRTMVLYSAGLASLSLPGAVAVRRLSGVQSLREWQQSTPLLAEGGWPSVLGRAVHAAAGIAVPDRFFAGLRQQGLQLAETYALPDHDPWTEVPWPADTEDVVVTEKDAVKLLGSAAASGRTRIWVARLDLSLPPAFTNSLDARLAALQAGTS